MHLRTILRSVAVRVRVVSQLSKLELVTVVTHKYIVLQEQAERKECLMVTRTLYRTMR